MTDKTQILDGTNAFYLTFNGGEEQIKEKKIEIETIYNRLQKERAKNEKRYYKNIGGKWKRISNKEGEMGILDYIKEWEPPNYRDLLKLLEPIDQLFQMVLNIILVKLDVRKSTLIELNNFDKSSQSVYKSILNTVIRKMKMVKTKNTSYRYFVTNNKIKIPKTDSEIAELLGFECIDHDFSNQNIDRVSYSIIEKKTNYEIYIEVCEKGKIKNLEKYKMEAVQKRKVKTWNKKLNGILPYNFVLQIEDIPAITDFLLRDNYTDKKYVKKNIHEYINIIYNEFFDGSKLSESGSLIMDNFKKFIFIMDNLKKIGILYNIPSNKYPSDGFNTLIANLKKFENDLLKGTDNIEEMEGYLNKVIDLESKPKILC